MATAFGGARAGERGRKPQAVRPNRRTSGRRRESLRLRGLEMMETAALSCSDREQMPWKRQVPGPGWENECLWRFLIVDFGRYT